MRELPVGWVRVQAKGLSGHHHRAPSAVHAIHEHVEPGVPQPILAALQMVVKEGRGRDVEKGGSTQQSYPPFIFTHIVVLDVVNVP